MGKKKRPLSYEKVCAAFDGLMKEKGVYHGVPLGALWKVPGHDLVGNTRDKRLAALLDRNDADGPDPALKILQNQWVVGKPKGGGGPVHVFVIKDDEKGTKTHYEFLRRLSPADERVDMWLKTASARTNSTLTSAERKARRSLKKMLTPRQWMCYDLDGAFIERSMRSHLLYVVRRSRPTLVISHQGDHIRALCCLCLHPLAYYEGSWAGALPPSDEAVTHVMWIRGDEAGFWRKANHIPIDDARSGV